MAERGETPQRQHRLSVIEIIKLLVVFGVTGVIVHGAWSMAHNAITASRSKVEYENKLESLAEQKKFLENTLLQLDTDDGREEYIRKELRVIKPGERMFIIK